MEKDEGYLPAKVEVEVRGGIVPAVDVGGFVYGRDRNPVLVYLLSLSAGSRRTMRGSLEAISSLLSGGTLDAMSLPWHDLRYEHTQAVRAVLASKYAPATANKMLSALRGVLREAWRLGYVSGEDYERARDIAAVRGTRLPKGRSLPSGEIIALFAACAQDEHRNRGARDAALLAVLYGAGLRRSEAVALDIQDYDPEEGRLRVTGKGDRQRLAYVSSGASDAISAWLHLRNPEPRSTQSITEPADIKDIKDAENAIFHPVRKNDRIVNRRLSESAVYRILAGRARQTASPGFSPHDLRRTFVSDLIDARGDISIVQQLAGHASPSTTARYDRRGERAKQKAARSLHVPYHTNDST